MTNKNKILAFCRYRKYDGIICVLKNVSRTISIQDCIDCEVPKEERAADKRAVPRRSPVKERRFKGERSPDRRKKDRRKKDI